MRAFAVSTVLFLSGASALLFQTLWLRLSGLVFGNSVWSAALVLSSFMAGLALGSGIAATIRLHRLRPLYLYVALEIVIAVTGCLIAFSLPVIGVWLRPLFQALWGQDLVLNWLRFAISFLILLVPTTAMGLTLPILLEDLALRHYEFGQVIGIFYGANTLGAVMGALIGEGFLIRAFGMVGATVTAALLNCAAAGLAFFAIKPKGGLEIRSDRERWPALSLTRLPLRPLMASFGTGAIFLSLEVVWFRFLRLYISSSPIAFAIILAIVLAGIGTGGLISGLLRRRFPDLHQFIAPLLIIAAVVTLVCYIFFPLPTLGDQVQNYFFQSWREIAVPSFCLMFPSAFCSGFVFPQIAAIVQRSVGSRINSVGITTLVNTIGAAMGPLLTSFVLLPLIGFQWSLLICAFGYALLGLFLIDWRALSVSTPSRTLLLAATSFLAIVIACFPYHRDEKHFANARRLYEADGEHLVKKIEGTADTYQLLRREIYGEPYYYRLAANAFSLASTDSRNQRYMRLFAYLPLFFRPESTNALLICYGCGVTADALTHWRGLQHIDVVDISKEVLAFAPLYKGTDQPKALSDARVRTFVQDGRFYLQANSGKYDVITGEPPPPKVAGTVNLYTREFFTLAKSRLTEGGIVSFWLPIAQLKVEETKSILRAFREVFPTVTVWASGDDEWIMMGINGPGAAPPAKEARRLWEEPATRLDLSRIGIEIPEQMASLYLMDSDEIDRLTNASLPLTDLYPKRLSDDPPDHDEMRKFAWTYMEAASASRAFHSSGVIQHLWPQGIPARTDNLFVIRESRYLSSTALHGSNKLAELDLYLRHSKLRVPVLEALHCDEFRLAIAKRKIDDSTIIAPEFLPDLTADALASRDFPKAIRLLEEKRARGLAARNDIFLLIYLDCLTGNTDVAESLAAGIGVSRHDDWFVDWLWGKLQAEFGFRPPA